MTTYTYDSLLQSRLNFRNGKARGLEWQPTKLPNTPLVQYTQGVPETVSKVIALALQLELPVGQWIAETTKSELPISDTAKQLLLSNVSDETVHDKAFNYLSEDYLMNYHIPESYVIFKEWNTDEYHPIYKSCYAEVGVFLVSLSILRLFGGESSSMVAANVSRDEMRHVATNRGILSDIGHNFKESHSINNLVNQTLDWLLSDLKVPGLDKDFFLQQSKLLIQDGVAPELSELTNVSDDLSPFESSNAFLY